MNAKVIILSGSVAPLVAGLGIGQVLHGHSWGYWLIAAGLAASVPYLARMARTLPWPARRREDEDCDCPFDYPYTCPACGHERITNHCPHDGIQNPCPECGWTDPGKETPLQFLGVTLPPGAEEGERRS